MKIVGKTEDGLKALAGIFVYRDTHGLPLMLIADSLKRHNYIIALDHFVREAVEHGWSKSKAIADLREYILYEHGVSEGVKVMARLEAL